VALYGYAHVPWMARRQGLIPTEALPLAEARLALAATAEQMFLDAGYEKIGIDHFALPGDGLAAAAITGRLRRNFQGYTDDMAATLIGLGASSISRFRQGYAQNAAATGAWNGLIRKGRLATTRGHAFDGEDRLRGRIIEALMCGFGADLDALALATGAPAALARGMTEGLAEAFPGMVRIDGGRLAILPEGRPLARMIAHHFDAYAASPATYSHAV
jgi:oxygen-independent coproporphyrinogen-3 oxidase